MSFKIFRTSFGLTHQPNRNSHYQHKYTLITLDGHSLVVRADHGHYIDVALIPTGRSIVDDFFFH